MDGLLALKWSLALLSMAVMAGLCILLARILIGSWRHALPILAGFTGFAVLSLAMHGLARWAPPPSQFVSIGPLLVHMRDEGPRDDPMPIVLLHGTSDSLHTWDGWTRVLRQQRRVIRFDLPGFGLTGPNAAGDYSMAVYVRLVLALLDQLGVQRFVIGGNSLGGEVAWATAHAAPLLLTTRF